MTAGDRLVAQLTQALAEANEALTAMSQAQEHGARAAEIFEHTTPGTNLSEVSDATAETRTTAAATLGLAATLNTAINDLQSYLDRLSDGSGRTAAPALPTGEELIGAGESKRSRRERLTREAVRGIEDVQEKSGQATNFVKISHVLRQAGLRPPTATQTGTVVSMPQDYVEPAPGYEALGTDDIVSTLAVVFVAVAEGIDRVIRKTRK